LSFIITKIALIRMTLLQIHCRGIYTVRVLNVSRMLMAITRAELICWLLKLDLYRNILRSLYESKID